LKQGRANGGETVAGLPDEKRAQARSDWQGAACRIGRSEAKGRKRRQDAFYLILDIIFLI
jgi:hypothetical protein